jgi:hypothetical protein
LIKKKPTWFRDTLQDAKGHAAYESVVQGFSQIEGVDFRI